MTLTTAFRFSLYGLVSLAASMLAYGEESFLPSGITIVLAGFSLFISERRTRRTIGPILANLLGLAALAAAGFEFFGKKDDARLLAGAHFLVYITWIVLLQSKGIRQYWWLSALSLLQVALGSVLTSQSGSYGLLLLAYLPLALWTLSVFTLYQGASELGGLKQDHPPDPEPVNPSLPAVGRSAIPDVPAADSALATLRQQFADDRSSTVWTVIQQDSPGRWIVPRFVMAVLGLAALGMGLGLLIFLFVPRVSFAGSETRFHSEKSHGQKLTGFSSEVRLGQIGQILESIDRVMRVRLFRWVDGQNDKPISLEEFTEEFGMDEPLFSGAVLDSYQQGSWRSGDHQKPLIHQIMSHPIQPGMIRQEYTLELSSTEYLFALRPITLARFYDPRDSINGSLETAALDGPSEHRDPVQYLVYSKRVNPEDQRGGRYRYVNLPMVTNRKFIGKDPYLAYPEQGLEGLVALSRELTAPERLMGSDQSSSDLRKAKLLEAYLRDSGEFQYTLSMEVEHPEQDPVEEFVLSRKRGHCEYFASALALMLRAVDIRSRLVVGFKGADYHAGAGPHDAYYEVQQRHAHAWVEALVDNKWLVLDPTPGEREEAVRQVAAQAGFWKNARNSLSDLWSTYVVSLSLDRQQRALYDPLTGRVSTGWSSIRQLGAQFTAAIAMFKDVLTSPQQYFSTRDTVWGFGAIALLVGLVWMARQSTGRRHRKRIHGLRSAVGRVWSWIAARLTGRHLDAGHVVVAFYQQFQDLMQAAGLTRRDDQTQREFAQDVERALLDKLKLADLQSFPTQLSELFYRVRFGAGSLPPAEAADVEGRLSRLAELLAVRV